MNVESLAPEEGDSGDEEGIEEWNVTQRSAAAAGRNPLSSNPPYEATVLALFRRQSRCHRQVVGQSDRRGRREGKFLKALGQSPHLLGAAVEAVERFAHQHLHHLLRQ